MPGDPVVGSTVLRRPAIQSPNYQAGAAGWTINQDGSAEFNNLTIRGTFAGTDFVINSSGAFFYSPSEAAGNLIASIAAAAGADQFGNQYLAGVSSYGASFASQLGGGFVVLYSGSQLGGWAAGAQVETDVSGDLVLDSVSGKIIGNITTPQPAISISSLPTDTNSGSTWVSGERAFMNNNWVSPINSNFSAIKAALQAAGITL